MTIAINCSSCGTTAKIPTSLFAERFHGRKTNIRCKRCAATIVVDDTSRSILEAPVAASSSGSLGAVEVSLPELDIESTPAPISDATPEPSFVEQHPDLVVPSRSARTSAAIGVLGAGVVLGALFASVPRSPAPPRSAARAPASAAASPLRAAPVVAELPSAAEPPQPPPEAITDAAVVYDQRALRFAMRWGVAQTELCHEKGGGPSGTIRVELSFSPTGKVSRVTLDGMSAPDSAEARCIVAAFRSVMIPAFAGESFTTSREIKLR
jgi:hypothetical protein